MTKAANMFEVTEAQRSGEPQGTLHLATGIGLSDLSVDASDCGQYLMINCGGATLAVIGAMGSDVGDSRVKRGGSRHDIGLVDVV